MRVLSIFCALVALSPITTSAAAQAVQIPLPQLPGNQEMRIVEVTLEPGQRGEPHRHNAHVFVYVLEGRVQMQVAGGELQTLGPGEMFTEGPDDIHAVSANASDSERARFLVHMIRTAGTPVSVPVP